DRLHLRQILECLINPHAVEDAKGLFADRVAQSRCSPEHLIEQYATVNTAQKNKIANLGDINTGGQQVNCHRNIGISLVLITAYELERFVRTPGNLNNRVIIHVAILVTEGIFQKLYD